MAAVFQMDKATQLNHWVALSAELEETREAIARAVYRQYKAGKIHDDAALDTCRRIDGLFQDAKEFEGFLKEDFKSYLEGKPGTKATGAEKARNKALSVFANWHIRRNVNSYKRNFRESFLELGARVCASVEDGRPVTSDPQIMNMVRYAERCRKECDMRWEEVQILSGSGGKAGNPFLTSFQTLIVSLTAYASTSSIPWLKKLLRHDQGLHDKLRAQYKKSLQSIKKDSSIKSDFD